ncbi:MAG: chromosome segregation SMC family protein [Solirubrobacteraceae bacterium]
MRLKTLTLKGFKSFPDRTRLDFGPGVSVVVGPNGSGKSNVTDAVLWAMGEQSPLAVRGQSMQDVIFGGGHGVHARSAAEVEIVLENSDGTIDLPLSEISIERRLDRAGEGGYRLNGAGCRLTDVIELLSDTGLGKETHSIISQGRVEQIVTSRPRDRRLLIEEAAGLGKHRKRRRRAQLKMERTQENLDRALDVEREARTRLRPLKRQAEAAQLHERLERQMLEARLELARDAWRTRTVELGRAQERVAGARRARGLLESELEATVERRGLAERALQERAERHDALARRAYEARSAGERLALRAEQANTSVQTLRRRIERLELTRKELAEAPDQPGERGGSEGAGQRATPREARIAALQAELAEIEERHERELEQETLHLQRDRERELERVRLLEGGLVGARQARERSEQMVEKAREGSVWSETWQEVRRVIEDGVEHVIAQRDERARREAAAEVSATAERVARGVVEYALKGVRAAEEAREEAEATLRDAERRRAEAAESQRRIEWLIEQRRAGAREGPLAVRKAQLEGALAVERRQAEQAAHEADERLRRVERLRAQQLADSALLPLAERLAAALKDAGETVAERIVALEGELTRDRAAGEQMAGELRACAGQEAEIQARLRSAGELVTEAEVAAQRLRDQAAEAELELSGILERLGLDAPGHAGTAGAELASQAPSAEATSGAGATSQASTLGPEQAEALRARVERLQRRREQLGPVNPLARDEYAQAVAHVEEMEGRRTDLETALRELRTLIRDTDRQIQETFQETFQAAARNFEELVADLFPGGSGRLRLVTEERPLRAVLGGQHPDAERSGSDAAAQASGADAAEAEADAEEEALEGPGGHEEELQGVEIEITPAGKSAKRLSLLSGGEKSMTALAFLFAVFLARPCPFYILDEVEAALDDLNLDRFLALLRRYSDRAQFIVITHQKRTMEAADWLFGVSMGGDGVSKVISQRLPAEQTRAGEVAEVA